MDLWAIVRIMNKWAKYKCSPLRCHKKNTEQATYALYNHHISFSYVCNSVLLNERDSIRATRFFARDVCVVLSFNAAWCVFCLVASAFHYKSFVFDCCFLYSPSASIWILFVTIPYHPPPPPSPERFVSAHPTATQLYKILHENDMCCECVQLILTNDKAQIKRMNIFTHANWFENFN